METALIAAGGAIVVSVVAALTPVFLARSNRGLMRSQTDKVQVEIAVSIVGLLRQDRDECRAQLAEDRAINKTERDRLQKRIEETEIAIARFELLSHREAGGAPPP